MFHMSPKYWKTSVVLPPRCPWGSPFFNLPGMISVNCKCPISNYAGLGWSTIIIMASIMSSLPCNELKGSRAAMEVRNLILLHPLLLKVSLPTTIKLHAVNPDYLYVKDWKNSDLQSRSFQKMGISNLMTDSITRLWWSSKHKKNACTRRHGVGKVTQDQLSEERRNQENLRVFLSTQPQSDIH